MAHPITEQMIENNFTYHAPTDATKEQYEQLRAKYKDLAYFIAALVPTSRELSTSLTHLETSMFWANAGIARN